MYSSIICYLDALSAVKLDPAVLEAQITIDTAINVPSNESEGSIHEGTTEKGIYLYLL